MFNVDWGQGPHWADAFQGMGTAAGSLISLIGFVFVVRQLRYTRQAIERQTQAQIYEMSLDVYKIVIEHPELGKYLYDNHALPAGGSERYKALSAFEVICDYFEYIVLQEDAASCEVRDSWTRYMTSMFRRSDGLREFVNARKEQYTPGFLAVYQEAVAPIAK